MISRRSFIGVAGGAAGAAALGAGAWATLVRDGVEAPTAQTPSTSAPEPAARSRRVLVVLELAGGNDALNTLVPGDGRYRDARPTLAIAERNVLALAGDTRGLHPALAPLMGSWNDGSMALVAGVGMAGQSRSHFKAMDSWWTGVPGGVAQTGWLGRWLDATSEGEPNPLRAVALGGGARALVATGGPSTVVHSPEAFRLRTLPGVDRNALVDAFVATAAPLAPTPALAAAQHAIPTAVEAVDVLAQVSGGETDVADGLGPAGGATVADLLATAAGIIDLDIGTRIITVGVGGFDTHADQANRQAQLLGDVAGGVEAFFEQLEADGNAGDVLLVSTTEFGRRVAENGSGGTDHGTGGLQFVCGPGVNGGSVYGGYDLANLEQGDLPVLVDTRSVYADALDWLGGPTEEILGGSVDRLGLLA